jgi:hypothetical protein
MNACEVLRRITELPRQDTSTIRALRRKISKELAAVDRQWRDEAIADSLVPFRPSTMVRTTAIHPPAFRPDASNAALTVNIGSYLAAKDPRLAPASRGQLGQRLSLHFWPWTIIDGTPAPRLPSDVATTVRPNFPVRRKNGRRAMRAGAASQIRTGG